MKIEIEGEEFDLEGLEGDSVVIMRPCKRLEGEELKRFNGNNHLSEVFRQHRMSLILANKDEVTFEVLKSKCERD